MITKSTRQAMLVTLFLTFVFTSCSDMDEGLDVSSDLVVVNARIWTANPDNPFAEALAVRGDRLVFVGNGEETAPWIESTGEVIDAGVRFVVPGFIDSHVHFLDGGFRLSSVQLRDAETQEDFVERIAAYASEIAPGTWITGGDWDHERWGGTLPSRTWIDSVTPEHPVWVSRLDGHMALANSLALELAGIPDDIADVEGGTIVREHGALTGVFKDNAMELVSRHIPDPSAEQEDRALDAAMAYVAEQGVTSVHEAGSNGGLETFRRAHANGRLKTRIYASLPLRRHEELAEIVALEGAGDMFLSIGLLKGYVDGSLGSHTAAFFEPFTDAPNDTGLLVNSEEDLYAWIKAADAAELHVMTHAIGDRAIRILLDIYERVQTENGPRDRRFRMEHAQHISQEDFPRFAELGVIASMQPYHAIDDGRWAEKVIGPERIKTTYAFRSLLDNGARLAFGSDWFVAPPIPLEGIYAAVTRRTLDGANEDGWVPEQRISVEEALRAYTIDAAFAAFEEDVKGSLEVGKLADFAMIDTDLTRIDPENLRDARVVMTVLGGEVVYKEP